MIVRAPSWEPGKNESFWGRQCGASGGKDSGPTADNGLTSLPFPVIGGSHQAEFFIRPFTPYHVPRPVPGPPVVESRQWCSVAGSWVC